MPTEQLPMSTLIISDRDYTAMWIEIMERACAISCMMNGGASFERALAIKGIDLHLLRFCDANSL